jgi:hypothetical protein
MKKLIEALQAKLGEEVTFSDELVEDLQSQYEVLINEKVQELVTAKETEIEEKAASEMAEFKDSLIESLDKYIEYASDEYLKENEIAMEAGAKVLAAEKIIEATRAVFENVGLDIPQCDIDTIKDLEEKVEAANDKLNEAIESSFESKEQMFEYEKAISFQKATTDLTETKIESVHTLLEGLEYKDIADFERKVKIVMSKLEEAPEVIEEDDDKNLDNLEDLEEDAKVESSIDKYLV